MKILNFTLLIAFCLCLSNLSFGQDRFVKAHIIDNNQQRIDGSIDFGSPIRNPDKIIFLDSSTLQISVYEPLEIQSFAVELPYERRYESRIVQLTDYPKYVEDLKESEILPIITDTIFVEVLIKGKASLYTYKDEKQWEHFFAEKDNNFQTLVQIITKYDMLDKTVIKLTSRYKKQLQTLFADCPDIIAKTNFVENDAASLQRIFTEYNACSGDNNEFTKDEKSKKRKHIRNLAINLGYRNSTLFLSDVLLLNRGFVEDMNFSNSAGFPIGLSLDLPLSKKNTHLSFYTELILTRFTSSSNVRSSDFTDEVASFNFRYFHYSGALRYRFGKENATFSPFVNLGGSWSYARRFSGSTLRTTYYTSGPDIVVTEPLFVNLRRFPIGGVAGFGAKMNRFSAEFRMEYTNGMSFDYAMKTNVLSAYLMFTYSLAW
jgi:hypothetical protein